MCKMTYTIQNTYILSASVMCYDVVHIHTYICMYSKYIRMQTNNELFPLNIQVGPIGPKLDLEVSLGTLFGCRWFTGQFRSTSTCHTYIESRCHKGRQQNEKITTKLWLPCVFKGDVDSMISH